MAKIWTTNVVSGVPDEHEVEMKSETHAVGFGHGHGLMVTWDGGFFTDYETAAEFTKSRCLAILKANKEYADNLKRTSGICLEGD